MTITSRPKRHLIGAAAALALVSGGAASADAASVVAATAVPSAQATSTGDAIIAVATGQATPRPANRMSNTSIVASVIKARSLAIPRALINAQVEAAQMAAASGLTLGPITGVSQDTLAGAYTFSYNQLLPKLGPNRYCGRVEKRLVRTVEGKRRILQRTVKQCYVPPYVTATLSVTFAASRAS